jgi:hypothetical protein
MKKERKLSLADHHRLSHFKIACLPVAERCLLLAHLLLLLLLCPVRLRFITFHITIVLVWVVSGRCGNLCLR